MMTTPSIAARPVTINPPSSKPSPTGNAAATEDGAGEMAFRELLASEMGDERGTSAGVSLKKGAILGNAAHTVDAVNPEIAEMSGKSKKPDTPDTEEGVKAGTDSNPGLLAQPFIHIVNTPPDLFARAMPPALTAAAPAEVPEAMGTVFPGDIRIGKNVEPGIDKDRGNLQDAGREGLEFDSGKILRARGDTPADMVLQGDEAKAGIRRETRAALDSPDIEASISGEANILRGMFSDMHAQHGEESGSTRAVVVHSSVAFPMDMDASQGGEKGVEFARDSSFKGHIEKYIEKASETEAVGETQILSVNPVHGGMAASEPGLPIPQATTSVNHLSLLHPHIDSRGWSEALSQKVLWMVTEGRQTAELSLNPPDLGPLQVVLSVDNDQASAMFVSQNPDVRQALEAALPRLKEMMAESGISLGSTTVSADSSSQAGNPDGSGWGGAASGKSARGSATGASIAREGGVMVIERAIERRGLVDTFA
jgi:hypothetical protein